jgi:hypothetical protein
MHCFRPELTEYLKQRLFDVFITPSEPATQHISRRCQHPAIPFNIKVILEVLGDPVTKVFKSFCDTELLSTQDHRGHCLIGFSPRFEDY